MEQARWARGGLNLDDSVEILNPDDWSYALNVMDGRSFAQKVGEKENVKGNSSISMGGFTDSNSRLIGIIRSAEDDINYLFFYNSTAANNCILKLQDDTISLVLKWSGLNFQNNKLYRINGGGIADDLLYFTDNFNQPRCVHLTRYSGGSTPANEEEILHIKRGPQNPPESTHTDNVLTNEGILSDVQFSYQYEYTDGQLSVISPWTALLKTRGNEGDLGRADDVAVRIGTVETIPELVSNIKVIARKGNNGAPFYIGDVDPASNLALYSTAYNEQNLGYVPSDYLKAFELVPLTAKTSTITKSRAWFGNYIEGYDTPTTGPTLAFAFGNNPGPSFGPTFPPNSKYRLGIVFHDDQGRSSGVVDEGWILEMPKTITRNATRQRIVYQINGTPPAWATYYSLVMTKDLVKTYFFENWQVSNSPPDTQIYVQITVTGTETYGNTYVGDVRYLRLDMSIANGIGIYYSFKEGDMVMLTNETAGTTFGPLKVRKIVGNFVYVDPVNIGNGPLTYNFQLYTPNLVTEGIYYEVGQRRKITAGVMDTTDYYVNGDTNMVNVQTVGAAFYMPQMRFKLAEGDWETDIGKPFVKTSVGQVNKKNFFRHSNPFIPGTSVNGLSEFQTGDEGSVPIEAVEIQKLQPTMKEATDGEVLLAICNSNTYSIYIGESRMATGDDQSFLVAQTGVIGDVRKQHAGFGTLHPESVHEEDGYVYFFDKLARAFVRYASNGLFPISEYKVANHFETQSLLNAISDIAITGYDPFYKMLFVTLKNANESVRRTIGFSLTKERWISFYHFAPDGYITGSKALYSVANGTVYKHDNNSSFNTYYGITYDSVIDYSFNDGPDVPKEWRVVQVQASPNFYAFGAGAEQLLVANSLKVDISNRHGQATDIRYNEFDLDENMIYGEIRGDANASGGIVSGDPIYSNTMQSRVTFSGGTYKQIVAVKAGCDVSRGHNL